MIFIIVLYIPLEIFLFILVLITFISLIYKQIIQILNIMNQEQNEISKTPNKEDNNDISKMEILLTSKQSIDFNKVVSFEEGGVQLKKLILQTINSKKRVDLSSEVKFLIQKYLYNNETNEFVLINKDYKNPIKKKISGMTSDEKYLRICLLQLFDQDNVLFILNQQLEPEQYKKAIKTLKLSNEKEEQEFENVIYYRIKVKLIINSFPTEQKKIKEFYSYVKKFYDEVRYFIDKGEFSIGEKWSNEILNKIFSMKKEQQKEFNEKKNKEIKTKVYEKAKDILSNKILCIEKKQSDNKNKDYQKAIKCIETEYLKYYKEQYDNHYLKIQGRLAMYCIYVNELEKAKNAIKEIELHCSKLEKTQEILKTLNDALKKKMKTKKENYQKALEEKSKDNLELDDYQWDRSLQEETLNEYLKENTLSKNFAICHMFNH